MFQDLNGIVTLHAYVYFTIPSLPSSRLSLFLLLFSGPVSTRVRYRTCAPGPDSLDVST